MGDLPVEVVVTGAVMFLGILVSLGISVFTLWKQTKSEQERSADEYAKRKFEALLKAFRVIRDEAYERDLNPILIGSGREKTISDLEAWESFVYKLFRAHSRVEFYFVEHPDGDQLARMARDSEIAADNIRKSLAEYKAALGDPSELEKRAKLNSDVDDFNKIKPDFYSQFVEALFAELYVLDKHLSRNLKRSKDVKGIVAVVFDKKR